MTAVVLRGDARALPLPDASVDLIVTSPPYFGQRDYRDGGKSLAGQIGNEETPDKYIAALLACTAEWVRVLKPSGSLFVNLGDKYGPGKSLPGLPWRYALGCVGNLGLILRAEIIWAKPGGLPESVTDRACRSHEQIFHLAKLPRYYAAVDEIRESYAPAPKGKHDPGSVNARKAMVVVAPGDDRAQRNDLLARRPPPNPLGKLPGSVWEIAQQPLSLPDWLDVEHFAPMPMEMARRCVLGWSPPGGVVLDPLGGVGTTALVAGAFGRIGISADLSHDYGRAAAWRIADPGERARALQVPKPPPVPDGQASLFEDAG